MLKNKMYEDIKKGVVKPLKVHVFKANQIEEAFRFMASGKVSYLYLYHF